MKSKNSKAIRSGYARYAIGLVSCVAVVMGAIYCFLQTARVEMAGINGKVVEYDRIYARQIEATSKADLLYANIVRLNNDRNINYKRMQSVISNDKITLLGDLETISERDGRLYRDLLSKINTFLEVKDSIRILEEQQALSKADLQRCLEDNRKASRKLSIGGIVMDNK